MPNVIKEFDWKAAAERVSADLPPEERRIVELLAQGNGTYKIARLVKTSRSNVWSKARKIRQKLDCGRG